MDENSQIQFINATFKKIECFDSNFISSSRDSTISFDSCQIDSVALKDSFFLNSNKTTIKIINMVALNLNLKKIQVEAALIKSYQGNIYILNILVYESNLTKFLDTKLGENNELVMNQTIFKKNYGDNDNFLSIFGINNHEELIFEMINIYFVKNENFAKFIYINQISRLKILKNISFDSNPTAVMFHCDSAETLDLEFMICSNNCISSSLCIRIENTMVFSMKTLFIFENIAYSDLNGIQILNNYISNDFYFNGSIINYYCFENFIADSQLSNEKNYGNCLHIDTNQKITIENSYFFHNTNEDVNTGSPCIYSNNFLAELMIINSLFYNNSAFTKSNCVYFVGINFTVYNSNFEAMKPISEEYDLGNAGSIVVSAEKSYFANINFIKNQAFKGASLFLKNLNGKKQQIHCEKVNFFKVYFKI